MENTIVTEFQKLRMFANCSFVKMDELVQDLTNALEESSKSQRGNSSDSLTTGVLLRHHSKKRRGKKRRSNPTLLWEFGNFSEASQSSVDEIALKDYMETVTRQSDSDDLTIRRQFAQISFPLTNCHVPQVESDSVTENFSPIRAERRRRRFKSMAIDPETDTNGPINGYSKPRQKRVRAKNRPLNENSQSNLEEVDFDNDLPCTSLESGLQEKDCSCELAVPGKRKRSIKLRCEVHGFQGRYLSESEKSAASQSTAKMDTECYSHESSSLSSSETDSDAGVITNDEGREGDDEQSDFFHEPGPACGIPGIIPWWESEPTGPDRSMETDPTFEQILTGSFSHLSPASQNNFKARVNRLLGTHGREIRAARRKLKDRRPSYTVGRFIQERQNWKVIQGKHGMAWQSANGVPQPGDIKKRRKTLPPGPLSSEGYVGQEADPIPETNIGNRMLQSMGWVPGTGLGSESTGITIPIVAYRRTRRQGLGCASRHSSDS